jgi:hypothetical protein
MALGNLEWEISARADARDGIARPHPGPLPQERGNDRADGLRFRRWPMIEKQSCGQFNRAGENFLVRDDL